MTTTWVDIDASVDNNYGTAAKQCRPVTVHVGSVDHLYVFYIDSVADLVWKKSTDGGATWGSKNTLDGVQTWTSVAVWYDRWTPGDTTGNTIHILAANTDLDLTTYFSLGVDDDLAETNNDVDIVASPGALIAGSTSPVICVATDGDIYVGWQVSATATGGHIYRSGDSGATWSSIYDRAVWDQDNNVANNVMELIPLLTDDDILCVYFRDNTNELYSVRYDGTATDETGWDITSIVIKFNPISQNFPYLFQYFSCVVDDNGDVYCAYLDGSLTNSGTEIFMQIYDESAGTWGGDITIYDNILASGNNQFEVGYVSLCYDKIDDTIFCLATIGETDGENNAWLSQSYDLGITWGDFVMLSPKNQDFRGVWMSKAILHADEELAVVVFNDDDNDLEVISGGVTLLRKTGNVVDDGGTAVTTADCKFFRIQLASHFEVMKRMIFLGQVNSDGSGNWSVPLVDHHNDTPDFQVIYDDDLANDETDASRRFST